MKDLEIERHLPTQAEYDRLWQALKWHEETSRYLKFHENRKNRTRDFIGTLDAVFHFKALRLNVLKDAFLGFYRSGALPEEAQPYERIFHRLRAAMDLLLQFEFEEDVLPHLRKEEAVLRLLQEAGLRLGEPNPVRLLFNRSDQALYDLYCKLKGAGSQLRENTHFKHRQVKVELLESPVGLEEIRPMLSQEPLLERWKVYGKVTLEDGRFKRFCWVPSLTPEGDPIPNEITVSFEEGEVVRFRLHHKAFAVRFSKSLWKPGEPLEVCTINFKPDQYPLRFLLASGGEARKSLEELAREIEEGIQLKDARDELIVEIRTNGQADEWRRIATLPIEVMVRLEASVEPQGVFVRTHPHGLAVQIRVFAGERLVREEEVIPGPQGTLAVPSELAPLRVELQTANEVLSLTLPPRGWPSDWWRLGLGFGQVTLGSHHGKASLEDKSPF